MIQPNDIMINWMISLYTKHPTTTPYNNNKSVCRKKKMFLRHTKEIKHYESSKKKTKMLFMLPDDGSNNCSTL